MDYGIFKYENKEYVYDITVNLCMDRICYEHGNNCLNCSECILGECNIDEIEEIIFNKYYNVDK